jgi:hypothetical protein
MDVDVEPLYAWLENNAGTGKESCHLCSLDFGLQLAT